MLVRIGRECTTCYWPRYVCWHDGMKRGSRFELCPSHCLAVLDFEHLRSNVSVFSQKGLHFQVVRVTLRKYDWFFPSASSTSTFVVIAQKLAPCVDTHSTRLPAGRAVAGIMSTSSQTRNAERPNMQSTMSEYARRAYQKLHFDRLGCPHTSLLQEPSPG